VPLQGRGRPIGALTLVMADSGRRFDEHDLRLAEEIGWRAGVALENARLYEAAQEGRAELAAVIAVMAEAVLLFDRNGELRLSNDAADSLLDGRLPGDVKELARILDSSGERELRALEGEQELDGGRWVEVSVYRTHDGSGTIEPDPVEEDKRAPTVTEGARDEESGSIVVVLRDVTETRTRQLARDAFIGVLSHELRTPITTIYGGSELLGRELGDEQRTEIVADIRAESERLARLVEDLLVMSRVERGEVEISDEPVLIQRLLPPLIESLKVRWPTLSIDLHLADGLPAVRGDATYLEQVLRNLLINAFRYGDGLGSGVQVTAREVDDRVTVCVLDTGPGPGTGSPERLFELFYRAPSARRVPGGAGIGLFVCRQLVEAMGGQIWARAREAGGSEFGFELPIIDAGSVD
jgi:signal transduction histidine kinase